MTTTTMPVGFKPNLPLLREVLKAAQDEEKRREEWTAKHLSKRYDQGVWRSLTVDISGSRPVCKTAMCFAGWAAELDPQTKWAITPEMVMKENYLAYHFASDMVVANQDEIARGKAFPTKIESENLGAPVELQVVEVRVRAKAVLGLDEESANILFNGDNSPEDIERMVTKLLAGKPLTFAEDSNDRDDD